ncbi:MAG: ribonuclease III [Holophagaceae bacterium]|nr:ribonuclease III [Holophagaceae bacterium]
MKRSKGPQDHVRKDVEASLQYRFRDPSLLDLALTHGSAGRGLDNQRLEYLGDALMNFCVARLIYQEQPDWPEGAMSKLRGLLVCTDALHDWAQELGLALTTGVRAPRQPGALRKPLADAVEALLAAVYLDAEDSKNGGLDAVMALVARRHLEAIRSAQPGMWEHRDSKTTLQEKAAAMGFQAPSYEQISRSGPDHQPTFRVRASVGELQAEANAGSLKQAEILAARELVEQLDRAASGEAS